MAVPPPKATDSRGRVESDMRGQLSRALPWRSRRSATPVEGGARASALVMGWRVEGCSREVVSAVANGQWGQRAVRPAGSGCADRS